MLNEISPDAAITSPGSSISFTFRPGTSPEQRAAVIERIKGWKNVATAGPLFPEATEDTDQRLYFAKVNVEGRKYRVVNDLENIDAIEQVQPRLPQAALTAIGATADAVRTAGVVANDVARKAGVVANDMARKTGEGLTVAGIVIGGKLGEAASALRRGAARVTRRAADYLENSED